MKKLKGFGEGFIHDTWVNEKNCCHEVTECNRGFEREDVVHLFMEEDDEWDEDYRGCLVYEY
ncbi:hypothetical protein E2C01_003303 [Portunus trituberculatus]|uniref:Uncharacterized protein n=1 Tax=Portunus trituberculatus TaxID=210409 RepID=A0A5B7CPU6_PORTR|nr:hypothetical protein [Portunus trituberculatus]